MSTPLPASELSPNADTASQRLRLRIQAFCVAIGITVLLGFTIRDYGLTNDEAAYVVNNRHAKEWLHDAWNHGPLSVLSHERLQQGWQYAVADGNRNLPLPTVVSLIGYVVAGQFDSFPATFRWGNVFVFAITGAVIFSWVRTRYTPLAGVVAVTALVGNPRLFAHANLLAVDTLVAAFWVLASYALTNSRTQWKWAIAFAVIAGAGFTCKPTFWFAFPVWLLWGLLHRPRELWWPLVCVLTITPLTAWLLLPMWWRDPVGGFCEYFELLLSASGGWEIATYYLGDVYQIDPVLPVPWHSVIVIPFVTTPIWILALFLVGAVRAVREFRDASGDGLMWLLCALALPAVCMLPSTPAHDGARMYRAAFYFMPMLAASGFDLISQYVQRRGSAQASSTEAGRRLLPLAGRVTAWGTVGLLGLWSFSGCYRTHPGQLSYYNESVGHLQGAATVHRLPMTYLESDRPRYEISYWWEPINFAVLREMQTHVPAGAKVWVYPQHDGLWLLREQGVLRDDIQFVDAGKEAEFIFLYGRMGSLLLGYPTASLFLHGDPIWETQIDGVRVAALFRRPGSMTRDDLVE